MLQSIDPANANLSDNDELSVRHLGLVSRCDA
jgi:hypothetical protein